MDLPNPITGAGLTGPPSPGAGVYIFHGEPSAKPRFSGGMIGDEFSESRHLMA
ncbi:unnamed protein product [Penicillium salamii]|nr:unnamed protein product [Penicillium salamii]